MARILFIRVRAETFDEKDVIRTWPVLYATVWPDVGVGSTDSPTRLARKLIPSPSRGVLELVDALVDFTRFGDISGDWKEALEASADRLANVRRHLDEALGDRDVHTAHTLTESIESALDEAEAVLRKLKK